MKGLIFSFVIVQGNTDFEQNSIQSNQVDKTLYKMDD